MKLEDLIFFLKERSKNKMAYSFNNFFHCPSFLGFFVCTAVDNCTGTSNKEIGSKDLSKEI